MASNHRIVTMIRVDPGIESGAPKLFWRYRDKEWGVVDCASIVMMERIGCETVFAYDRHFVEASRQRGFTVL
jgi:predicted nucleic acid-binding protein